MKILLSNDDGVYALGLRTLHQELLEIAEVTVVAPDRDRSAASKSLTLNNPLRPYQLEDGCIAVNGTPTDCVHLALMGYLNKVPDMVIAGINHGANLGDDVLYSGTVAAATEGRFLGYPAIAVSLVGNKGLHYKTAARVIKILTQQIIDRPLPKDTILNVNVPDLAFSALKGIKVTRLGARHQSEGMVKTKDPRGRTIYWIGPGGTEQEAGPGTDFHAVRQGYVSITPLQIDLTRHEALPLLTNWVQQVNINE